MTDSNSKTVMEPEKTMWQHGEETGNSSLPWGPHKIPLNLEISGINISLKQQESGFLYYREVEGETIEKLVLAGKSQLFLSPVEPMNIPVKISSHLLIDFNRPLVVEPQSTKSIFVTFPLEIAVALGRRLTGESIIDIFSKCKSKYTLYGTIKDGIICKYWQSDLYNTVPDLNPTELGVMQIEIQNPTGSWAEVKKAVFSAHGMKIYYGQQLVTLNSVMKIINEHDAETSFIDSPLKTGLKLAYEQFSSRTLIQQGKTLMEEGY